MNQFSVRPYGADDHADVTDLYHAARPLGTSPPAVESGYKHRYVAVDDAADHIVAYGESGDGDTSSLRVMVLPAWQRRGVGRALWGRLREAMASDGVAGVEAWVREENAAGVAWLAALGFTPTKLDGPVRLTLTEAEAISEAAEAAVIAQGLTITTLADEKAQDADWPAKLHTLYATVEADTPWGGTPPPIEEFAREWGPPDRLLFLAKDGVRYVGLSTGAPRGADPFFEERGDIFQQHLTGVLPEYRRRGIATALKQRVMAHARQESYQSLWTNSDNPAIRALNKKLGFRSGPWRVYAMTL